MSEGHSIQTRTIVGILAMLVPVIGMFIKFNFDIGTYAERIANQQESLDSFDHDIRIIKDEILNQKNKARNLKNDVIRLETEILVREQSMLNQNNIIILNQERLAEHLGTFLGKIIHMPSATMPYPGTFP